MAAISHRLVNFQSFLNRQKTWSATMLRLMGGLEFESAWKNESHPVGKIGQVALILPSYFLFTFQDMLRSHKRYLCKLVWDGAVAIRRMERRQQWYYWDPSPTLGLELLRLPRNQLNSRIFTKHMGQFLQDGENGHFMSIFFKSRAFVWPNLIR